jgi:hypothetical protein
MENKMIAVCGLDCSACGAYLAWKNDDDALRARVAAEWKEAYHFDFTKDMINCSGCRAEAGPKIGNCAQCQMRNCKSLKAGETCATCKTFPCDSLKGLFSAAPEAEARLRGLQK